MIIGTALNAEEIANISGKWKDILFVLFDLFSMSLRDKTNLKNSSEILHSDSLSFNLGAQMDTYETLGKLEELCGL